MKRSGVDQLFKTGKTRTAQRLLKLRCSPLPFAAASPAGDSDLARSLQQQSTSVSK